MSKLKLTSNMEDYLETIAALKKEKGVVRVTAISKAMNVKNSSVTSALNFLSENGYVIHERYGYVDLTPEGAKAALKVQKRHDVLLHFFSTILKINPETAASDACRMEHSISPETLDRLTRFLEFIDHANKVEHPAWLDDLNAFMDNKKK